MMKNKNRSEHFNPYFIILAVFSSSLVIAQFLAAKLVMFEVPSVRILNFPSGVLAYGLTFLCTDVISEVWGKRRAERTVGVKN